MIKRILIVLACVAIQQLSMAQTETLELGNNYILFASDSLNFNVSNGKATIVSDIRTRKLLNKFIKENKINPEMDGWRVQIYWGSVRGTARKEAEAAKRKFRAKYSDVPVYMTYEAPIFKVRVGDFRTKSEALKFRSVLPSTFANSYPVMTKIKLPKL